MKITETPDIIIPISMELDNPTEDSIVADIIELYENFGYRKFMLAAPCAGWRKVGYPPVEHFASLAKLYARVAARLSSFDLELGWWNTLTLRSGKSDAFSRTVCSDGTEKPGASCPLDPAFVKRFSSDVALFCSIAKPSFVMFEDDYSICAASDGYGCFCKYHLDAFARRMGKTYTREDLRAILTDGSAASEKVRRKWRELLCDSLVLLSEAVRREVDKLTPEIPIGYMQSGHCYHEGDCTEKVSRALAGSHHTPFSRIYGATYCDRGNAKTVPEVMYNPLYSKQHIKDDFLFYYEADSFPHTRFYLPARRMKVYMACVFSFGYDGATFQVQQLLDHANEEPAYAKMYASERKRFAEVQHMAKQCTPVGVGLEMSPNGWNSSHWTRCIGLFGIPYVTEHASVNFADGSYLKEASDEEIMKKLRGTLFVDGSGAKLLCERGFDEYLGVTIGEDTAQKDLFGTDLAAREIICVGFAVGEKGRNMTAAHMYACGANGKLLEMTPLYEDVEIITETYGFEGNLVTPSMTRYRNALGGTVIVMGMTLENNVSQALFNYRRARLIRKLVMEGADEYVCVTNEPDIYVIQNETKNGFIGMLTLTNLDEDEVTEVRLHLPPKWRSVTAVELIDKDGSRREVPYTMGGADMTIPMTFAPSEPVYLIFS